MSQKGLTIILVAFLLISLCIVAGQVGAAEDVGFSEKLEEMTQQLDKQHESITELTKTSK